MTKSELFVLPMVKPDLPPKCNYDTVSKFLTQKEIVCGETLTKSNMSEVLRLVTEQSDVEDSFFVADVREMFNQYEAWVSHLPRIKPHFAIKSNPDPVLISILASLGTGFDCASKAEITQILDMGISPSRIIYAHPCKPSSHLSYAVSRGVDLMTFDNFDELHKMKKLAPNARAVLRISTDDSAALCRFSVKFGAPMGSTYDLLCTAKSLGINVVGVSFHVGSGCQDDCAFDDALQRARTVFDQAESLGFNFNLLDIGGGFPSSKERGGVKFSAIAANINASLDRLFPPHLGINIISEPGRYFSSSAYSLAVNITSKRAVESEESSEPSFMYYVNDGVYGSFNCIMFDHQIVYPEILTNNGEYVYDSASSKDPSQTGYKTSIWGPTCDSLDCVVPQTTLPELYLGDWLLFQNMGAYTKCAASKFNGFDLSAVYYYDSQQSRSS
ncbi:hypothetical protein BB560_007060 [Smittium megazygosporum]|uniref:ornithine decarboxylase n=1 Tax=Smittium megazygosporum TaxID=133381 RepID=A0A2T9XZ00_9FUNG|nr:hypothetical protein BB560_007060 [Smittium megazygosporum]